MPSPTLMRATFLTERVPGLAVGLKSLRADVFLLRSCQTAFYYSAKIFMQRVQLERHNKKAHIAFLLLYIPMVKALYEGTLTIGGGRCNSATSYNTNIISICLKYKKSSPKNGDLHDPTFFIYFNIALNNSDFFVIPIFEYMFLICVLTVFSLKYSSAAISLHVRPFSRSAVI